MNAPGSISCDQRDTSFKMPFIQLIADEPNSEPFINGTTITMTLGYIKNPLSFKPTSSFYVASILPKPDPPSRVFAQAPPIDTDAFYFINVNSDGLPIRNSEAGDVVVESITQPSDELDQATTLTMQFKTANKIPLDSIMIVTLPSNLVMEASEVAVTINGE